jgi:hypothetical protein
MRLVLCIALLCGPSLASADTPDPRAMHTDDCANARKQHKTCVIDMGKGTDVETDRPTDQEIKIDIRWIGKYESLVRIRRDFIIEILKTTEDL